MLTLIRGCSSPVALTTCATSRRTTSSAYTLAPLPCPWARRLANTMPPSATRTTAPMSNFFTPAPLPEKQPYRKDNGSSKRAGQCDLDGDEQQPQDHRHRHRRRRRDLGGQAVADDEQDQGPEREEIEARQQRLERRAGRVRSE